MRNVTFRLRRQEKASETQRPVSYSYYYFSKIPWDFQSMFLPISTHRPHPITHKNLTRTLRLLKINMNIKHNYYSNKYKCYHYLSSPHFGAGRVVALYWLLDLSRLKVVPSQAPTSGKMRQISASVHKNYPSLVRHGVGLAAPPPKEV